MASTPSPLIRTFSHGARWQQLDYKLAIYLIHSCDLGEKTNFSVHCWSTVDSLDLLSAVCYWVLLLKNRYIFLWFERRLVCRLKKMRFRVLKEKKFWSLYRHGLSCIIALWTSSKRFIQRKSQETSSHNLHHNIWWYILWKLFLSCTIPPEAFHISSASKKSLNKLSKSDRDSVHKLPLLASCWS